MKLFALPDGTIDQLDRAAWLTPPFDLSFDEPVVPPEPELPESADSLGASLTMASRRISFRRERLYPIQSKSPNS